VLLGELDRKSLTTGARPVGRTDFSRTTWRLPPTIAGAWRISTSAVPISRMYAGRGPCAGFKDEKGYGRITADDGKVLFVYFSGIVGDG
jgi:hypothetical protein